VARATLESGMAHIVGFDRDLASIVAGGGDDYVEADNPLRFIDAFVDGLALAAAGFARVEAKATAGPATRRGALRSVRRPMRPKRPQFLATRSSRRHRACSMRTREDHSAIRGTLPRMTAVGATRRPISSTQPHAGTPLPSIGFSPGSRAPDVCDLDWQMTALRRLQSSASRK
jgi:hypothetical protein